MANNFKIVNGRVKTVSNSNVSDLKDIGNIEKYIIHGNMESKFRNLGDLKSGTFSDHVQGKLMQIAKNNNSRSYYCKFGIVEHLHIYSKSATEKNGYLRICHVQDFQSKEMLHIKECYDTRAAGYSSLYKVFLNEIDKTCLKNIRDSKYEFDIPYANLDDFIDAIKNTVNNVISKKYDLVIYDNDAYDTITIDGISNIFHKVYWADLNNSHYNIKRYLRAKYNECINKMNYTKDVLYEIVGENEFNYTIKCDEGVKQPISKNNGELENFELVGRNS